MDGRIYWHSFLFKVGLDGEQDANVGRVVRRAA